MTNEFPIDADWLEGAFDDPVERASFALISMSVGNQVVTELEDIFARTIRPGIRASAHGLALWIAGNWWRLRWEPEMNSVEWRMSHTIAAAGEGFAWPRISFASGGIEVLVQSRKTYGGRGNPVRYLRDADIPISASIFETGIDNFVEGVLARISAMNVVDTELPGLWREIAEERQDADRTAWRRLEALLGFDAGDAPDDMIFRLLGSAREAGPEAVNEVAAASKAVAAVDSLQDLIDRVRGSHRRMTVEPVSELVDQYLSHPSYGQAPWERAEADARLARAAWGVARGPLANRRLSEILSIPERELEYAQEEGGFLAGGYRQLSCADELSFVLRAKMPTGRRFELLRLAADHLTASADDKLLPVTMAKTDRQKYQRAFASEFLLPYEDLLDELGRPDAMASDVGNDDIDDVAERYQVSPLLVRTTLVNKGLLARETLAPPF